MSIKIDEHMMTSDITAHMAYLLGTGAEQVWTATWLGDEFVLGRNQAVAAIVIAEWVTQGKTESPMLRAWSAELGLQAPEAVYRVINTKTGREENRV